MQEFWSCVEYKCNQSGMVGFGIVEPWEQSITNKSSSIRSKTYIFYDEKSRSCRWIKPIRGAIRLLKLATPPSWTQSLPYDADVEVIQPQETLQTAKTSGRWWPRPWSRYSTYRDWHELLQTHADLQEIALALPAGNNTDLAVLLGNLYSL